MDTKKCVKCKTVKPLNEFNFNKRKKDGHDCYCKRCSRERDRLWIKTNPEKKRKSGQCWYKNNRGRRKTTVLAWKKSNPEKHLAINRRYGKKRNGTIQGKLTNRMRANMWYSLKDVKAGRNWEQLVGFTVKQLEKHLKKLFTNGMTWELFLEGKIHIDHKIPISVFNYEKPEDDDFKKCWALKNLQPLWAKDNLIKHAKLDRHFQPSLVF